MTNVGRWRWLGDGPRMWPSSAISSDGVFLFLPFGLPGWPAGGSSPTCRWQSLLAHTLALAGSPFASRHSSGTSVYWTARSGLAWHLAAWSATHGGEERCLGASVDRSAVAIAHWLTYWSQRKTRCNSQIMCSSYCLHVVLSSYSRYLNPPHIGEVAILRCSSYIV